MLKQANFQAMKFPDFLLFFFILFFYAGCKCEGTFTTFSVLVNSSNHTISIFSYRNGVIQSDEIILNANSSKEIGQASGRSKGIIWSTPFFVSDSLLVIFDNTKKVIHYGREGTNKNAILQASPRSLFNENNYQKKTVMEDKCYLQTELIYTFVEQDYINVK